MTWDHLGARHLHRSTRERRSPCPRTHLVLTRPYLALADLHLMSIHRCRPEARWGQSETQHTTSRFHPPYQKTNQLTSVYPLRSSLSPNGSAPAANHTARRPSFFLSIPSLEMRPPWHRVASRRSCGRGPKIVRACMQTAAPRAFHLAHRHRMFRFPLLPAFSTPSMVPLLLRWWLSGDSASISVPRGT